MAYQENRQKRIAAVVAAYNEAPRIGEVLSVLVSYPEFSEIIVVDDGSSDGTAQAVASFPVRLISLPHNKGKGAAMDKGVEATSAEIIFFCDADVRGLSHEVIRDTISPVREGESAMVIAMRNRKIYFLSFVLAIIPLLGGERAIRRELWEKVPARYKHRFMIEAALNFYARYYHGGFSYKVFRGLSQTVKEKKYGFWKGFEGRVKMFYEVIHSQILLELQDAPPTIQSGRIALAATLSGVAGALFGIALLAASRVGAFVFVEQVFASELQKDPDAPFVHFLLYVAGGASKDLLVGAGIVIIAANLLVVALGAKNIRHLFHRTLAERLR